tara:strand:+ start:637 stop:834 length:198 start_codon:yes stop_codon:yes gene_type:complete
MCKAPINIMDNYKHAVQIKILPLIVDDKFTSEKILNMKQKFWLENLPTFVNEYNVNKRLNNEVKR